MTLPEQIYAVGSLAAIQRVTISSEIDGRIKQIFFKNGDFVAKEVPIIQLDNATAAANLSSAEAALKLSQTTYARYLALSKEGAVSQETLDQMRSDMTTKTALVQTNAVAFKQKQLVAPFSGVLGTFKVTVGGYIKAGDPLVNLVDKEQLKVSYTLSQMDLPLIALGQNVTLSSEAFPGKFFQAKVSYISPTVNQISGSVTVQATVNNAKGVLSPGMFVYVTQTVKETKALVIPEQAIIAGINGDTVYRVIQGRAVATKVSIGARYNGYAEVKKGLKLNDTVVIAGQQKLKDETRIRIQK